MIIKCFCFTVLHLCCKCSYYRHLLLSENYCQMFKNTENFRKFVPENKNRMNKYRKMYNENFLGTSDVSILKFFYASFKIQQGKGNVSDVGDFIDSCTNTATSTSKIAKFFELLPLVPISYSTELKRIAKFMTLRRNDVETLFLKDNVSNKAFEDLLYGTNKIQETPVLSNDEKLAKVRKYIIICNSKRGIKQLGDRIFGYLLKSEVLGIFSPSEREKAWDNFVGGGIKPSNPKLLGKPNENRNETGKNYTTLIKDLKKIHHFFNDLQFDDVTKVVNADLQELAQLAAKK